MSAKELGVIGNRSRVFPWICLGMLFFTGFLAFATRLAPAVAVPDLQATFGLSAAEVSVLTAAYLWPFALMQPIAGFITDRVGPRRTVTVFLLVAGVGQVVLAMAPTFSIALFGRACSGIGASTLYVAAARIMVRWFRRRDFGTLTGLWTSIANLGAVAAAAPLAALLAWVGWRASFAALAVAVLATAVVVWVVVRDSPTELGWPPVEVDAASGVAGPPLSSFATLRTVVRERNTWLLGGYAFLLFGTMTTMQGLWAVPYLVDIGRYSRQTAANLLTLWGVGLIVGCTLWGYVADRVAKTRKGVVCGGALAYALLWVVLALRPAGLPDAAVQLAMFWGGFFASTWIPAYALLRDSVPPSAVATAMGTLNLCFWLGGAFYQQASGILLEAFVTSAASVPVTGYRTLFWACLASVVLSAVLAACSRERPQP